MEETEAFKLLKQHADFLIRPKTYNDKEKVIEFLSLKVASYSHTAFPKESNQFYKGLTGHMIRKNYRRDLMKQIRIYVDKKLKEIENNVKNKDN